MMVMEGARVLFEAAMLLAVRLGVLSMCGVLELLLGRSLVPSKSPGGATGATNAEERGGKLAKTLIAGAGKYPEA